MPGEGEYYSDTVQDSQNAYESNIVEGGDNDMI